MIGKQNAPAIDLLPEPQPLSTPIDNAQTPSCAGPLDTSIPKQTEVGPAVLQQGEEAAPESATAYKQLEDCETGDTASEQNSIGLGVETPNITGLAGPQSPDFLLRSLTPAQALPGSNGFRSQQGVGQTGQHPEPSLAEMAKEAKGNGVIAGAQANAPAAKPEPQLPSSFPVAMNDPPMVRAAASAPSPIPTNYQGVQEGMLGAWQGHLQDGSQIVKAAQLIAHLGSVEMRVELTTEDLGSMELRAMMHGNRLGAAIGVDTLDAKTILAIELPGLQRALMERNVQLDAISIFSGSSGGALGHETGHRSPSGNSRHSASEIASYLSLPWEEPGPTQSAEAWYPGDRWVRLSVRA
jgi:flagellar hook-length control protein FliK